MALNDLYPRPVGLDDRRPLNRVDHGCGTFFDDQASITWESRSRTRSHASDDRPAHKTQTAKRFFTPDLRANCGEPRRPGTTPGADASFPRAWGPCSRDPRRDCTAPELALVLAVELGSLGTGLQHRTPVLSG